MIQQFSKLTDLLIFNTGSCHLRKKQILQTVWEQFWDIPCDGSYPRNSETGLLHISAGRASAPDCRGETLALARKVNEQLHDTYFWTPQEKPAMVMHINLSLTVAINVPSETLPTPASAANTQRPAAPHCAEAPSGSDEPSPALPPHLGKKHEIEAKFSCTVSLHTKRTRGNRNTCTHSYSSACPRTM